jgi:glucokinase
MGESVALGVDIGGTKIAFALVNQQGDVLRSHRLPTPVAEGAEAVFQQVATGIHHLLDQTQLPIAGIGMGSPGHLNPHTGLIYNATNLYWNHINLIEGVRQYLKLDLPLWLQKDGNAAALGEYRFGAARGYRDFVLITIGTGLGGGAIVDGEIVLGAHYSGMEIGHMPLDPTGRMCICGMNGCPEMYVSGVGLLAGAREYLADYPQSRLNNVELTTQVILDAFVDQDPLAMRLMDEMTDWLCSVMIACMGILNPEVFVIGGGLGHALFSYLKVDLKRKLLIRTRREIHQEVPILESQVQDSALGPACLVWHKLNKGKNHANTD